MKLHWVWVGVASIVLLSLFKMVAPLWYEVFPFTFDQARDLLWVRNQLVFMRPSLVGPWGSLAGIFFGPLWFWLLLIPFVISGGDPVASTLFNAMVVLSALGIFYGYLTKHSRFLATLVLCLGVSSPFFYHLSQYAFSQHLLPILTILLCISLAQLRLGWKPLHLYLSLLWIGLMFHAEPPLSLFSYPILLWVVWQSPLRRLRWHVVLAAVIVLMVPFLPSLFFDMRHDFIQLKSLVDYLLGQNQSLGDVLPFSQRLIDRPLTFFHTFNATLFASHWLIGMGMVMGLGLIFWSKKFRVWLANLPFVYALWQVSGYYLLSLLLLFLLYPPQLKPFYLDGIPILFIFWVALGVGFVSALFQLRISLYLIVGGMVWLNLQPLTWGQVWLQQFAPYQASGSVYKNQKAVIDWIYQDARGKGFRLYSYVPAVYDYPYQYLVLWRGLNQYHYLPEEFAYMPQAVPYVEKKEEQIALLRPTIKPFEGRIYLIIESDDYQNRQTEWLQQFEQPSYQLVEKHLFPGGIRVEKRQLLNLPSDT